MKTASWIVCKAFMQKCPPERRTAMIRHLPKEDQALLDKIPTPFGDPTTETSTAEEQLSKIHYSWLAPYLRMLSENEIRLFLSALDEAQSKGLKKTLLFSNHLASLTSFSKQFLCKQLFSKVTQQEHPLPISFLPDSPLNALLSLSYEELVLLTGFLGIRDLALEVRRIIDKEKLKQIQHALSHHQQLYLKSLLQQKDPIAFKSMELGKWDGRPDSLKVLLHQRGINRLAKALYHQDKSLIWHIAHRLDSERGESLLKFCTPLESTRAAEVLGNQALELIPYIQNLTLSKQS